jgi:hypothetical protein
VAAHQHYLICQILLVSHNPRRPQLGPRRTESVDSTEVNTLFLAELCGRLMTLVACNSKPCKRHLWDCFVKQSLHTCHVHCQYGNLRVYVSLPCHRSFPILIFTCQAASFSQTIRSRRLCWKFWSKQTSNWLGQLPVRNLIFSRSGTGIKCNIIPCSRPP